MRMTPGSIMVSGGFACPTTTRTVDADNDIDDLAPGAIIGTVSAVTDYHHGPPPTAPTGFTAYPAGPDARRLVWDAVSGLMYELRYTADATDPMEWTMWAAAMSGHTVSEKLEMGTEYVFELRGSRRVPCRGW